MGLQLLSLPSIKRSIDPIVYGGMKGCVKGMWFMNKIILTIQRQLWGGFETRPYKKYDSVRVDRSVCPYEKHDCAVTLFSSPYGLTKI